MSPDDPVTSSLVETRVTLHPCMEAPGHVLAYLSSFSWFRSGGPGRGGAGRNYLEWSSGPPVRPYSPEIPCPLGPGLEHHVELGDQEVDVAALLGLEGLGDDARGLLVLLAPQRLPIHLQDHVAYLELPTVMG